MHRFLRYLFENEYHTKFSLSFRLRHLGTAAFPADPPALFGIHPSCHRPQEPAGRSAGRRLHGVPLCVRGGEFCGLRKFVSWLLTKKASNRVAELNVCEKVNKLLPNWGCLQIGYEKSLTMTLCREYK